MVTGSFPNENFASYMLHTKARFLALLWKSFKGGQGSASLHKQTFMLLPSRDGPMSPSFLSTSALNEVLPGLALESWHTVGLNMQFLFLQALFWPDSNFSGPSV